MSASSPPVACPVPGPIRWRPLCAALSLAGLSACTHLSAPQAGAGAAAAPPPDAAWLQAEGTAAQPADEQQLARWWALLGDPSLSQQVRAALDHNPDLRTAQASLREAQAARRAVEAGSRPQVGSSASAGRSRSGGQGASSVQLGFAASWEPDFWGQQAAGIQAAQADAQAAALDLQAVRISLVAEVALAHLPWRDALARQALTRASLARLQQTAQLTGWRAQAGLANGLDAEQARLALRQTEASLPQLATEIAQASHQLALLTGQTPAAQAARTLQNAQDTQGAPVIPAATAAPAAPATPAAAAADGPASEADALLAPLAVGLPADLLLRRPDLRAAEAAVQAQWARREQTRLAGRPSLSLSGSLGWQAAALSALGGAGTALATVAASVDWNLFDGGQRQALVDQQDATLDRSRLAYEAALLAAVKDVEDSLVALRQGQAQVAALAEAERAAQAVRLLTGHRQAAGLVDLRSVLDAERAALSAQTSLQTARSAQTQHLVRLYKALGGGWDAAGPAAAAASPGRRAAATTTLAPPVSFHPPNVAGA